MALTPPALSLKQTQVSLLLQLTIVWALFCWSAHAQSKINPDANPWVLNYTSQGEQTPKSITIWKLIKNSWT
jgi:hypothetical protein